MVRGDQLFIERGVNAGLLPGIRYLQCVCQCSNLLQDLEGTICMFSSFMALVVCMFLAQETLKTLNFLKVIRKSSLKLLFLNFKCLWY